MSEQETAPQPSIAVPTSLEEVDALLVRKIELRPQITEAKLLANGIVENAKALAAIVVSPLAKEDQAIDDAIRRYALDNRSNLLKRFGKTIKLPHGTLKWFIRRSVELPANEEAIVTELLRRRGGKKYLIPTYSLDEGAIRHASRSVLRLLSRKYDVVVGRFEHLNINVDTIGSVKLDKRRYFGPLKPRGRAKK